MEYYPELLNIYKITLDEYDKKCSMPEGKMLVLPFPAKEIRALVNEIDRLNKLHEWIPVSKRLPEENVPVLTIYSTRDGIGSIQKRCYVGSEMWYDFEDMINISQRNITHWQPLPTPPTEG